MKKYLLFIILLIPFFGVSQKRYVGFGFEVTTPCNLYENKTFKKLATGNVKVVEALVCATEKPNAAIYNLNVYLDDSGSNQNFNSTYQRDLINSGIAFRKTTVSGLPATEYTFTQNGVPAKALVFYQSGKSYLLQVTSNNSLESRFFNMKNSFKLTTSSNVSVSSSNKKNEVLRLENLILPKLERINNDFKKVTDPNLKDLIRLEYMTGLVGIMKIRLTADLTQREIADTFIKEYTESLSMFKAWGY